MPEEEIITAKWLGRTPSPTERTAFVVDCGYSKAVVSLNGANWVSHLNMSNPDFQAAVADTELDAQNPTNPKMFHILNEKMTLDSARLLIAESMPNEMVRRVDQCTSIQELEVIRAAAQSINDLALAAHAKEKIEALSQSEPPKFNSDVTPKENRKAAKQEVPKQPKKQRGREPLKSDVAAKENLGAGEDL